MSEYARKTIINYCGIELEVYMLPDGGYTLSRSQVALAINNTRKAKSLGEFLQGNSLEALSVKDLTMSEISIGEGFLAIKSTPIKVAMAYWSYHAKKGNIKAQALLATGTEEMITRLADQAFGLVKTEVDYTANRNQNFETNQQVLTLLGQLLKQNELVLTKLEKQEKELAFLKPMAEEFAKINHALVDLKQLKPLLEQISEELKSNPNQRTDKLTNWLKEIGMSQLSSGKRKALGRLVSDFLKVGNLQPPAKNKGITQYPESMKPLIELASRHLV